MWNLLQAFGTLQLQEFDLKISYIQEIREPIPKLYIFFSFMTIRSVFVYFE